MTTMNPAKIETLMIRHMPAFAEIENRRAGLRAVPTYAAPDYTPPKSSQVPACTREVLRLLRTGQWRQADLRMALNAGTETIRLALRHLEAQGLARQVRTERRGNRGGSTQVWEAVQ